MRRFSNRHRIYPVVFLGHCPRLSSSEKICPNNGPQTLMDMMVILTPPYTLQVISDEHRIYCRYRILMRLLVFLKVLIKLKNILKE